MERLIRALSLAVMTALIGALALTAFGCASGADDRTLRGRVVFWNVPEGELDGELRLSQSVDAGIRIERVVSLPVTSATRIVALDGTVYSPKDFYEAFGGETDDDSVATGLPVVVTVVGSGRSSRVRKIAPISSDPEPVSAPWPTILGESAESLEGMLTSGSGPSVRVESPAVDEGGVWTYYAVEAAIGNSSKFQAGPQSMNLNDALQAPSGWVDMAGLMKVSTVTNDEVVTVTKVERVGDEPSDWHRPWQ